MNLREYAQQQKQQAQNTPQDAQNGAQGAEERADSIKAPPPSKDPYKGIYRAVFDYHERHAPFPQTSAQWRAAAEDMAQVSAKHGGNPFINSLLMAVYEEFERLWKNTADKERGEDD